MRDREARRTHGLDHAHTMTLKVTEDMKRKIEKVADTLDISQSEVIRRGTEMYLIEQLGQ